MERYYTNQNVFLLWFIPITVAVIVTSYILASLYHWIAEKIGEMKISK